MSTFFRTRWISLAMAGGVLALVAYLAVVPTGRSQGVDASVALTSAVASTDSQAEVYLFLQPEAGVTVGALRVLVDYDSSQVTPFACSGSPGVCNSSSNATQVAFAYANVSGLSGTVGSITFNTLSAETVANLTITLTTCADEQGIDLFCATQDGTITISSPTPTPIPTPSPSPPTPIPTPSPTPSPSPTPPQPPLTASPSPGATPQPLRWGDVNCDGTVNSVDALAILRKNAGLPVFQVQPCPIIGAGYP